MHCRGGKASFSRQPRSREIVNSDRYSSRGCFAANKDAIASGKAEASDRHAAWGPSTPILGTGVSSRSDLGIRMHSSTVPKSHEKQVADLIQVVLERILVEGIRSGAQGLGSLIPKLLGDLNREPGVGDEDSKVGPVGLPPGKEIELVHHEG
jgi:hypothetical protein